MTLNADDIKRLSALFAAHEHEFLNGKIYIKELPVCDRLDSVDPSWEWRITKVEKTRIQANSADANDAYQVTVYGDLTVKGVTRSGSGTATFEYGLTTNAKTKVTKTQLYNEAEKSGDTDALKRAARRFGVGRYLLTAGDSVNERNLGKWLDNLAKNGYAHASEWTDESETPIKVEAPAKPSTNGNKQLPAPAPEPEVEDAEYYDGPELVDDTVVSWEIVSAGNPNPRPWLLLHTGSKLTIWEPSRKPFIEAGWFTDAESNKPGCKAQFGNEKPVKIFQDEQGYWHVDLYTLNEAVTA